MGELVAHLRTFTVYVYNHHPVRRRRPEEPCRNSPLAYLRYASEGGCRHQVQAKAGVEAKRLAIAEHEASTACSQVDLYCDRCRSRDADAARST